MALNLLPAPPRSWQAGSSSATHVEEGVGDDSATFLPLAAIPGIRVIAIAETETHSSRKLIRSRDWGGLAGPESW